MRNKRWDNRRRKEEKGFRRLSKRERKYRTGLRTGLNKSHLQMTKQKFQNFVTGTGALRAKHTQWIRALCIVESTIVSPQVKKSRFKIHPVVSHGLAGNIDFLPGLYLQCKRAITLSTSPLTFGVCNNGSVTGPVFLGTGFSSSPD